MTPTAHALRLLEAMANLDRPPTMEERQQAYEALRAAGYTFGAPTRTYENHRGAGTPAEFGRTR